MPERRPPHPLTAVVAVALVALGYLSVAFVNADLASSLGARVQPPGLPAPVAPLPPERLIPILVALAALCVLGLAWRTARTIRGLAAILAVTIGAVEIMAAVRGVLPYLGPEAWAGPSLVAVLAAVAATAVGAAFVAESDGASGWSRSLVAGVAILGIGAVTGAGAWAVVLASEPSLVSVGVAGAVVVLDTEGLRLTTRLALGFVAGFAVFGSLLNLWPAARRAWARSGGGDAGPTGHDLGRFGVLLADELLPWRAAGEAERRRAVEDERVRLAAELHARVLPDLRLAAASAAATPGVPEPVAIRLRHAVEDVEGLMVGRQSVVLEEHGLLAALEWLAERTEARAPVRVTIDPDEGAPAAARPPRAVERAAFRIALLALDNVVRHAEASTATITLATSPSSVRLEIRDDGRGIEPDAPERARLEGRRGLADMRMEAAAVEAAIEIGGARTGAQAGTGGTIVRFRWPA